MLERIIVEERNLYQERHNRLIYIAILLRIVLKQLLS